jgi:hypothetical protein
VIVSDFSDWWQTVLVLFRSDRLGLATIVSACLDIRLGLAIISGTTIHLVGYLYEDYHDARSLEHKIDQLSQDDNDWYSVALVF